MARRRLDIVFEDGDLIVVNKPAGLLTVPLERRRSAPSVYDELVVYLRPRGKRRPFVVHRIDEDTSGLVVFAKSEPAQTGLRAQFRRREPRRVYLALVHGRPDPPSGTWRDQIAWDEKMLIQKAARGRDGEEAISEYRVRESYRGASLLEVRLVTGRRNQIRIQAHLHGCPLVGEKRYKDDEGPAGPIRLERQALHAWQLAFVHPSSGRLAEFEAPLPADFAALLERLRPRNRSPKTEA